ncbi:TonB-dependent receptor [Flavitalea sp. BT771]|uniref:SusC/RagA family TonB-linked outer membrane protein n=1 Tax=Flavitalea sp. BT771 TaxID=3063329 RepID=UPI0026E3159B|nr:TonB-dependent receptor [Flavitalea sp. BT771]MDO6430310.1 TonB-dependent receptor [Flavitalea sp. BT771]MDV6219550.1 TonB-dependent receptor [Flavitalea sp. BT771]
MRLINMLQKWSFLIGASFAFCCLLMHGSVTYAQEGDRRISGKVTDKATGEPLQGATITSRKGGASAITDSSGNFSIQIRSGATLLISLVGYASQEIRIDKGSAFNAVLEKDYSKMDEVVVIGYGTARKRNVVGALDIVAAKDAGATASTNPSQLLIGKSAGVQVVQSSGAPGADAQIIVRGTGSFTGVDPLYVIDGIQGDKTLFNALSTQDIDNITVLKDASSTAIYGSAAANGVVIITTKKGKAGAPRITVTSQWGMAKAWKQLKLLKAAQYVDLLKDFAATGGTALPAKFNTPAVLVDSNDWQKNIFRQALVSENDINISGGSEKTTYTLSLGYITQQSTVQNLTNNRLNTRFALDENLGRFHFGQSLAIRYTRTKGIMANVTDAIAYAPYKPILDPNIPGGYSIESNIEDFSNAINPLQALNLQHPLTTDYIFFPQAFGEVSLLKGLRFRSQISGEIGGNRFTNYQYPYTLSNYLTSPRQAQLGYGSYSYYILENYLSFDRTYGKHAISAVAGNSYIDPGNNSGITGTGSNIPNDNIQNFSVAPSQTVTSSYYGYARASVISYYGRLSYTFDGKYILTGSFRRDGASNFGPNNRFGNFPGAGAAWRFSDEDFMKSLTFLSEGKLRVGWGKTGNNSIPTTGITSVLTFSGSPAGNLVYSLGSNEAFNVGTTINTLANPDIKWEATSQTDVGMDLSFLNNKLYMTLDWYNRKSTGLLVQVPVPGSTGASLSNGQPVEYANAASAYNRGIEVMVGYRGGVGKDLSYNVSANFSYNKNKVLSLGSQFTAPIKDGPVAGTAITYTAAGSPVGAFYGYKVDHVAKDQAEIDALNAKAPGGTYQNGLLPGDFIYKDLNGNGVVTDSDQVILGSPIPKFIYGFNAGVTYGDFDLNLVLSGIAGVTTVNGIKNLTSMESYGHNATTDILNRWRKPGDVAALPRAGQNYSNNSRPSDWWTQDGSYLRLRNITVGYSLPKDIVSRIAGGHTFTRIRVYLAAQNLLTVTKYSGYDPEIGNSQFLFARGIDQGSLPQPRTLLAGVQLGF